MNHALGSVVVVVVAGVTVVVTASAVVVGWVVVGRVRRDVDAVTGVFVTARF